MDQLRNEKNLGGIEHDSLLKSSRIIIRQVLLQDLQDYDEHNFALPKTLTANDRNRWNNGKNWKGKSIFSKQVEYS